MSELFPLHEWKEKEEDDRIAFAIHFATGVKSRMPLCGKLGILNISLR